MKRITLILTFVVASALLTQVDAGTKKTVQENAWMDDQTDQTDTYAIPLDNSEAEEEVEEETLQREARKYAERRSQNRTNRN